MPRQPYRPARNPVPFGQNTLSNHRVKALGTADLLKQFHMRRRTSGLPTMAVGRRGNNPGQTTQTLEAAQTREYHLSDEAVPETLLDDQAIRGNFTPTASGMALRTLPQWCPRTLLGNTNIYLDRFDQWVEQSLLPEYNRGRRRRPDKRYQAIDNQLARAMRHGDREAVRLLRQQRRRFPSQDPNDPDYRRLRYVRYCDDFLLGFAGSRHEAEQIKAKIRQFLREQLKLDLSESRTLITHAVSQAARFLGYEIRTLQADTKITAGRRSVNARIGLFVPKSVVRQRCARYMRKGKPAHRGALLHDTDFTIVAKYGSEYRGLVQY